MQQKSRAVVFIGMVYPGGIVRHLALLGVEIAKCIHDCDYYFACISGDREVGAWDAVRAELPMASIIEEETFAGLICRCDVLFAKYETVLVHCGGGWGQTKHLIPLRRKYGKRLVLVGTTHSYRHDTAMRIPMSTFQAFLYLCYYDMIVFQCQYAADQFWGARALFRLKKAVVIPLGCELFAARQEEVPSGIRKMGTLQNVLVDRNLFKFVYLASFRPGKMHAWLVRAMAPVLRQYSNARVLFCGGGNEKVEKDISALLHKEGLDSQVIVPGRVSRNEVPWLLGHCNCAVVPSRAETFGHNFLEPMFAGLPVLGTPVGIGRDIIKDGETGQQFSLKDVTSFRRKMEWFLGHRAEAVAMGSRAKSYVVDRFTHMKVAQTLSDLYCNLLGKHEELIDHSPITVRGKG